MPRFLIILILFLFSYNNHIKAENNDSEWIIYFENEEIIIEYTKMNCEYEDFFNQEFVIIQLTNKTNKKISVSWKEEIWYDNNCHNCEQDDKEFRKLTILNTNEILIGKCNFHSNLKIFSKFSEKLEDMPGVNKIMSLTNFELKNIQINDE